MTSQSSNGSEFLKELDSAIDWEWKWEKQSRYWGVTLNLSTWVCRLLLLALGWYQITDQQRDAVALWPTLTIAIISMLNIALPLLSYTFRFQQRQEVYDTNAREYSTIRVEYLSGQLSLADAVRRFSETRRKPTEKVIRNTA